MSDAHGSVVTLLEGGAGLDANPWRVKVARESRGLTVADLAERINAPVLTIRSIEAGTIGLNGSRLDAAADALGYPVEFFLDWDDPEPGPTFVCGDFGCIVTGEVSREAVAGRGDTP